MGAIDAIGSKVKNQAGKYIGKEGGKNQAGAFLAQVNISKDDFAKKGHINPPGLTEGGSAFAQQNPTV